MPGFSDYRKIVCIDLDHTLFNNEEIRNSALTAALSKFELGISLSEKLDAIEKIRDLYRILQSLGFPHLIHYWNEKELYIFLAIFFSGNEKHIAALKKFGVERERLLSSLVSHQEYLDSLDESFYYDYLVEKYIEKINSDDQIKRFKELVAVFKANGEEFSSVQNEYERNFYLKPHPFVVEFLDYLKQENIETVLISEGIEEIQIDKLKRMNLLSYFQHRILTTGRAATPEGVEELETYWKEIIRKELPELTDVDRAVIFFRRLINDMNFKENKNFYRRIFHVIKSNGPDFSAALKKMSFVNKTAWENSIPLKMVMIGDRYDKDVKPIIELLGRETVKTIRIITGKYKDQYPDSEIPLHKKPAKTCSSFKQIHNYFHRDNFWEEANNVPYIPPALIEEDHKHLWEIGKKSRIGVIKRLAEQIEFQN